MHDFQVSCVAEGGPGCAESLRGPNFHHCAFHDRASPDAANHGATDNHANLELCVVPEQVEGMSGHLT